MEWEFHKMSINLYLPDRLRYSIAKGKDLFEVNGRTIGECLDDVVRLIPGMKQALYYDNAISGLFLIFYKGFTA